MDTEDSLDHSLKFKPYDGTRPVFPDIMVALDGDAMLLATSIPHFMKVEGVPEGVGTERLEGLKRWLSSFLAVDEWQVEISRARRVYEFVGAIPFVRIVCPQ